MALAVVTPTWVLAVGFILFRYSVLSTVDSLSLLHLLLYLYLYVLEDIAWISKESFMQIKHRFVLIHIYTKGEVGTVKPV